MSGSTGGSKCGECGETSQHSASCSRSDESVAARNSGRGGSFAGLITLLNVTIILVATASHCTRR